MNGPARPPAARYGAAFPGAALARTALAAALAAAMACAVIAGRRDQGAELGPGPDAGHAPRPARTLAFPFPAGTPPLVTASIAPEAFASFGVGLSAGGDAGGDAGASGPAVRLSAR